MLVFTICTNSRAMAMTWHFIDREGDQMIKYRYCIMHKDEVRWSDYYNELFTADRVMEDELLKMDDEACKETHCFVTMYQKDKYPFEYERKNIIIMHYGYIKKNECKKM